MSHIISSSLPWLPYQVTLIGANYLPKTQIPQMESLKSPFIYPTFNSPSPKTSSKSKPRPTKISCTVSPDPWSLSDGNFNKPKPKSKNPKNPLSDDNARRIIKGKAKYLSELRRNQGSSAQTPKWIKRTPEQMAQYLEDDRNGHLYGRHVVAAIQRVRSLSGMAEGTYDMRQVMGSFVMKLSFREMCTVLKEQKSWRQVRDFFAWMKLQLSYRPSTIAYTIVLRIYGQVGKIKLAEETFLEMLEAGCEPDEVACGTMLCTYARWGRHKVMLSFYSAVQERGILLPVSVFNFMLSSLQKKSLHGNVIEVWRHMTATEVVPNHFTFTVVIGSLLKEGLVEEALRAMKEMKNLGLKPEEITYNLLINFSSRNGNYDEAARLYEDMRLRKIVPSKFTCASLLTLFYKTGNYSKAVSLFSEMVRKKIVADEVIYGLLIRIYGKLGLYEDAEKTFIEIEKLGLLSDDKTYITMAQVHLTARNHEKALSIMEKMRSKNIRLSRFALIVMLQCYAMKADLRAAEATFQALSKTGFPDSGSCSDMLDLYMRLGLSEKAKDFTTRIRKIRIKFDEELFRIVMKVYCKERMTGEAEKLIEDLGTNESFKDNEFFRMISWAMNRESTGIVEREVPLKSLDQRGVMAFGLVLSLYMTEGNDSKTEQTLKLLLKNANGLCVASQLVGKFIKEDEILKAEYLYGLLVKLGCKPEIGATSAMISIYGKKGKLEQAKEVFAASTGSHPPGKPLYNSIIDAFAKCGKLDEAYLFYKEETQKGHDLGAVAISMLVNNLANFGKFREAENVIHDSFNGNLELDTVAYNSFIKAMLDAGQLQFAVSIYERMVSSGQQPSSHTYNAMISVYGRGRNLNKAVEIFNLAETKGVALDEKAYTNLIYYHGKAGDSHKASLLFSQMQEKGIKPGLISYNIMLNIYAMAGLLQEAEVLFRAMRSDGWSPDASTYLSLIRAYSEGMKYSEAEEAIASMQKEGISPYCAHFCHLLFALAKVGLVGEAERVYKELIAVGLTPNLECHQHMVGVYLNYGHVEKGILFFEKIRGFVKTDRFIMSAAVHFYRSAGLESKAEDVLNSMNNIGILFLENLEVGSKRKVSLRMVGEAKKVV